MQEHLRLGTIAGIPVGINISVLVIVALLVFGVAFGQLPMVVPDRSTAAYLVAGLIGATVFLASLLAHELSHALVARRQGVEVEGITLWMLGGVAKLRGEAPTPGAELAIAAVGPAISLLLGLGFGLLAVVVHGLLGLGLVTAVLAWLALINVVLGVFNLAPAAPLDGGRILRALLWWRRGDPVAAAVTAAGAGRLFGFLLVTLGLVQVLLLPGLGGLWLILVGFFIVNAAAAEGQAAQVRSGLAGLRVADVMSADPVSVPAHLSVDEAVDGYVLPNRFSSFPIVGPDGSPVGLLTLPHVKAVPRGAWGHTSVQRIATPLSEVVTAAPESSLIELLPALGGSAEGRALVLCNQRVVGIVSPTDLARALDRSSLRGPGPPAARPGMPPSS